MKFKKSNWINAVIIGVILLFSSIRFGTGGFKLSVVFFVLLWLPAYVILSAFPLKPMETGIISWLVGFVLLSSFAFPLGLTLGTLSMAAWLSWIILLAIGFVLHWKVKPLWKNNSQQPSRQ